MEGKHLPGSSAIVRRRRIANGSISAAAATSSTRCRLRLQSLGALRLLCTNCGQAIFRHLSSRGRCSTRLNDIPQCTMCFCEDAGLVATGRFAGAFSMEAPTALCSGEGVASSLCAAVGCRTRRQNRNPRPHPRYRRRIGPARAPRSTAPLPRARARAISAPMSRPGYGPESVDLVEGARTGTKGGRSKG